MKKKVIITLILIWILLMIYFTLKLLDPFHTVPIVKLSENLIAIRNEKVSNISYIEDIQYGKIISKEKDIDTSKLGKQEIILQIENKYGKNRNYKFYVEVVSEEEITESN